MNPNPYRPEKRRLIDIRRRTAGEYTLRIEFDRPTRPGQFFELSLPKFGESPFSISEIGAGYIDMTIRNAGGRVTPAVTSLKPGRHLHIRGPYGNGFDLEELKGRPLIVAAGGVGLSPVKPLIDHFRAHPEDCPDLQILLGFKKAEDILFPEDIEQWRTGGGLIMSLDQGREDPRWRLGLLPQFVGETRVADNTAAVVVGPPIMMKFTIQALLEHGVAEERIWISQERKMCCGLGHCGHCKISHSYVCLDGPVYNYAQCRDLFD